jgi:hypothetical protein
MGVSSMNAATTRAICPRTRIERANTLAELSLRSTAKLTVKTPRGGV